MKWRVGGIMLLLGFLVACGGGSGGGGGTGAGTETEPETQTPEVSTGNLANARSPLAINVAPFAAWTPGWVLVDAFPKTQPWVSNLCDSDVWGSGPALDLDERGWVTELPDNVCADTSVYMSQAGHYPAGTYVLLWEGEGTITARWDVEPAVTHLMGEPVQQQDGLNRLTFTVDAADQTDLGIGLRLSAVGSDPLRNIRLIPPGGVCGRSATDLDLFQYCATDRGGEGQCDAGETCQDFESVYWDRFRDPVSAMNNPKPVFHPLYAAAYRQYRAVRYMKWTRVEEAPRQDWSERVRLDEQSFADDTRGFPYEYMLAFSNLLNAHAWMNVPVRATDDYVASYADLVEQQLNPSLKVFLEYGNEMFNPVTPLPFGHALDQANEPDSGIPASDSDLVKVAKFTARRSAAIFDIWDQHISNPDDRLVKVLVGFNPVADFTLNVLDFESASEKADALAINGYIGPSRPFVDDPAAFDAMDVDDVLNEIQTGSVLGSGSSIDDLNAIYLAHADMATQRDLILLAYEGSNFMELDGAPSSTVDTFMALNRDPRLAEAFVTNFQNFAEAGGQEFFHFLNEDLWNEDQVSGALRFQDETRAEAPVFDGLMQYIENNDCGWEGCALPPPP